MGWQQYTRRGRGARVSIGVAKVAEYRSLVIYVSEDVMNAAGLAPMQTVVVLWGNGAEAGWMRIAPDPNGIKLSRAHRGARLTTSRVPPQVRLSHHSATPCKWRAHDGGIEIETPPWLWEKSGENLSTVFVHKSGEIAAFPAKYQ